MPTIYLDPGESHSLPAVPLLLEVSGATVPGLRLDVLTRAGDEVVCQRYGGEVRITPEPRRVRLVLSSGATPFPPGTNLGLVVRPQGASAAGEQVVFPAIDVGALRVHEFGVLEFAPDRAVLTAAVPQRKPDPVEEELIEEGWLAAGRYAFRSGRDLIGQADEPVAGWSLVLDGSASMASRHRDGLVQPLLELLLGVHVEWTRASARSVLAAGIRAQDQSDRVSDPAAICASTFVSSELATWSTLGAAVAQEAAKLPDGCVVAMSDGVPGDVDRIVQAAKAQPGARFHLVVLGRSVLGLSADPEPEWWAEELAGLADLASLPNVRIAALLPDTAPDVGRAAQLAARLTGRRIEASLR